MAVKINAKILGIKTPIEVKESNKNIKKALKLQLFLQKADDKNKVISNNSNDKSEEEIAKETIDSIQLNLEMTDRVLDFISDILRLNDKQRDNLEDLTQSETMNFLTDIYAKLMHIDDSEHDENAKK